MPERKRGAAARRVPGGKALLRLIHFLRARGYHRAAELAIQNAVAGELRDTVRLLSGIGAGDKSGNDRQISQTGPEASAIPVQGTPPAGPAAAAQPPAAPTGPPWRSLGPVTIPNGQTSGSSRVNVAGRVSSIAIDPRNPAHVLCGAAAGGVWESFDRGTTWAPRTDFAPSLAVGAIAFDPNSPGVVYCGTGEGNFYSQLGAGVLKSVDSGATWNVLCTDPFLYQGFFDLKIDPSDSQHLLSANNKGLYQSHDGGANWTPQSTVPGWSISIASSGGPPAEILAARKDGLWQSTDGGLTWNPVALPGAPVSFDRLAVAHAPSNPDIVYVFGAGDPQIQIPGDPDPTHTMSTPYLWQRTAAGAAYSQLAVSTDLNTSQDWYDWFLAVAPDNPNQIYLGAIESWRVDIAGAAPTWTALSDKGAAGDSIHPDQHAIAFEPGAPDTIYIGCDGGLFRSPDRGITWQHCNNGLVITEFEYLAQNVTAPAWLIGGTQDNGTQRYTGNPAWDHVMDGDGGDCSVNRNSPNIVFAEYYGISPQISTSSGDWNSWSDLTLPITANETSPFYCPFTCSANGGDTVALGTIALYISRDNGTTWTRLPLPATTQASALYVPNADKVFVGNEDGSILHSNWDGTAWTNLTALATPRAGAMVSSLYADPNDPNRVLATYSTYPNTQDAGLMYVSTDGGTTWTDRTPGLPNLAANIVEVDPRNSSRLWVGTDQGVFQSLDLGATWTNFSNGLPNVLVGDLLFHPTALLLRAGTRSRGVWEVLVDG